MRLRIKFKTLKCIPLSGLLVTTYLIIVGLDSQSLFLSIVLATNTRIVKPTKNLTVMINQFENLL